MTTRQYLRFSPGPIFGIIASPTSKILHINFPKIKNDYVAVAACETVLIWNLQTKEKFQLLQGETSSVTYTTIDHNNKNIAVGYADGVIRIFDVLSGECVMSFSGHKSAVSCLAYDEESACLASGGKDSEIVLWNVTEQAGLFRLKGHKGSITKLSFLQKKNILISSSLDTFMKFWDLDTQHCFQTLIGNRNEIFDFIIIKETRLITGINGPDLKIWELSVLEEESIHQDKKAKFDRKIDEESIDNYANELEDKSHNSSKIGFRYKEVAQITTKGDKNVFLCIDKTERLMGSHASGKTLELFKILTPDEALKKFHKKKRKEKKRKLTDKESNDNEFSSSDIEMKLIDEFERLPCILTPAKIESFSSMVNKKDFAKVVILLKNNCISLYSIDLNINSPLPNFCSNIILPGHRSLVRSLNYSSDGLSIMSTSDDSIKIWKSFKDEQNCTHTLDCSFALCSIFLNETDHCIIGTKFGKLEIFEIDSKKHLESIEAHKGSINSMCLSPDKNGITTGSSDKEVHFWNFELIDDETNAKKKLTLTQSRVLKMPDEILCICYSPDKTKFAISLLDFTVQVLYTDSLRLAFSLYGHTLPVTCLDISYDSLLIVTGSEDRDIRIWSMEFGSCNKFLKRAHDKGITCIKFIPKTHMFFSGGRDKVIKQWDADNFQKIISLKGHQNDITAFSTSPDGSKLVSASRDKSLRIWEKTKEPLVLEEEQENEREEMGVDDLPVIPGEANKEIGLPSMKTNETIKSVDQLIEAIDVYKEELFKLEEYEKKCKIAGKKLPDPTPNPLLVAYSTSSPIRYMQKVVNRIKSSELEGTLLYLPFNYVLDFLKILCEFVERGWEIEFCERCSSFLLRIHMGQILSTQSFRPVIEKLKNNLFNQMYHLRDLMGFALTVTQFHQKTIDAREEVPMFTNILDGLQNKKKKHKKKLEHCLITLA